MTKKLINLSSAFLFNNNCRGFYLILKLKILLFLVLCLPRQVRTSNGSIHHDPQLSPSTCCNPLSASSPVTSFLVFLFSFFLPFFPRSLSYDPVNPSAFVSKVV